MSVSEQLSAALADRKAKNLYRQRSVLNSAQGPEVLVDGKPFLAFCSNDYLGLANHPEIVSAFQQASGQYGVGSGASHLVCGHGYEHHTLEEELAEFTGRERALLFSTGYMANLGTVNALLGKQDYIFEDKINHASLLDAGLLSGARFQRYLHNDLSNLERRLSRAGSGRKLIAVDGVFSMDGDYAALTGISQLAEQHDALLMVDDAHGFGCVGASGRGVAEHFNLSPQQLPILICTLGKALGTFGAFVAGSEVLIETLIQYARPYIYTTALPPAIAAATRASLQVVQREGWRRDHLNKLIAGFRTGAEQLGLNIMASETAIQPLLVGDSATALKIGEKLAEQGFLISAIRPPTVPVESARLRITLSAAHTEEQVDRLLDALAVAVT